MRKFIEMTDNGSAVLLLCIFIMLLLHIMAVTMLWFRERKITPAVIKLALPIIVNFCLLVLFTQGRYALLHGWEPVCKSLMAVPIAGIVIYLSVFMIIIVGIIVYEYIRIKNNITYSSIKESLNYLPAGLCFSQPDGTVMLSNYEMHTQCRKITGEELQNAKRFWETLICGAEKDDFRCITDADRPIFIFSDGSVRAFKRSTVTIGGMRINEITSSDISELYRLTEELKKQNEELEEINERMVRYGENVDELTRQQEWLDTKVRIHGDFGQTLLVTRRFLADTNRNSSGLEDVLDRWKRTVYLFRRIGTRPKKQNSLQELYDAASSGGIDITIEGEPPVGERANNLFLAVAAEALTNAVKHADATELHIKITKEKNEHRIRITNNGTMPDRNVIPIEGGGLGTLRKRLEGAGGTMKICNCPEFVLEVVIPERGEGEHRYDKCSDS